MKPFKIAILDLYNGEPNQGMRCILDIVGMFKKQVSCEVFDTRAKEEIPSLDFDIYISTGGPGSPFDGGKPWEEKYYAFIEKLWQWNLKETTNKKYVFFICHSFQMACHHFQVAKITKRKSKSFGTFPIHKTEDGKSEKLFQELPDPFYGADFRDFQVIQPDHKRIEDIGAKILAIEKIRPHVDLERAIMTMRFSDEFFGTQFHPEADPEGMLEHFSSDDKMSNIIEDKGIEKYIQIINDLQDPDRIELTYKNILPGFIADALKELKKQATPLALN